MQRIWLLLLLLGTAAIAPQGAAAADGLLTGQAAIDFLGLDKQQAVVPGALGTQQAVSSSTVSPNRLRALLLRDTDLKVSTASRRALYECSGLKGGGGGSGGGGAPAPSANTLRKLLSDHSHRRDHEHGLGRSREGNGYGRRRLQQLVQASSPDPTTYSKNAAGLPLLHRRGSLSFPCPASCSLPARSPLRTRADLCPGLAAPAAALRPQRSFSWTSMGELQPMLGVGPGPELVLQLPQLMYCTAATGTPPRAPIGTSGASTPS
jgi:hypothetical protein